ncbi:MAG: hypothetical protein K0Q55_1461 [Verrucomicrobia bacterium]|nr:hypothetical protein [Verrucomicrobiota bacterium]
MLIRMKRINIYLALALALVLTSCASADKTPKKQQVVLDKKGKEKSFLRVFLQEEPDGSDRTAVVSIYRARPIKLNVHKEPFLDEGNLAKASVEDDIGGFALKLEFNRRGTWLLENQTTAYKGRQMVIASLFGDGPDKLRWLAAPYIGDPIKNGVLRFSPDATREEAERIALGLNNVIKEVKSKNLIKDIDDK